MISKEINISVKWLAKSEVLSSGSVGKLNEGKDRVCDRTRQLNIVERAFDRP